MSEDHESVTVRQVKSHQFAVFLVVAVLITIFFVFVALSLYQDRTIQLDLSRPGYEAARKQISGSDAYEGYAATGDINKTSLDEFKKMFDEKSKEVTTVDAFSSKAVSDSALRIK